MGARLAVLFALLGTAPALAQAPPSEPNPAAEPTQPAPSAAAGAGPVSQTIWPGIVRWYPSAEAKEKAPPSLIVQIPPARFGPGPDNPRIVPVFGEADGVTTAHVAIEPGTSLYGAGVVPGPLLLNGRKFVAAPADRDLPSMSLAMPWIVAVRPDGTAFGVMADTTWRTEIDLTDGITMRADGPTLPIVIVDADSPLSPSTALSQLAGWQEIPPRWAFGLHLGLVFVGVGGADPRDVAKPWREHGIPIDGLWVYGGPFLPVGHTPNIGEDNAEAELRSRGWHVGITFDPGLRMDIRSAGPAAGPPNQFFEEGVAGGHWILRADRSAHVHPIGSTEALAFPDVARQETRQWWAGLYRKSLSAHMDGIDHLFVAPSANLPDFANHWVPDDALHNADPDLGGGSHARFRSTYWSLLARVAKEAMKSEFPEKRPLVLTSSPSLISQRYAYTFIPAPRNVGGVAGAIPAILNASMSGQVMIGIDVPPGVSRGDGSDLAWNIAVASMLPMLRLEGAPGGWSNEPWSFSPEVEKTCREALERRSRLIPYLYTIALDAYRYGIPMVRPLMTADPANPALRDVSDAYLLGGDILVRLNPPDGEPNPDALLPGWRKFDFGEESKLLPEMYIRPGAIIPVGQVMQHDGEKPLEPLTLLVHLNEQGEASGVLYEDSGDGLGYAKGENRMGYYQAARVGDEVVVRLVRLDGGMGMAKRKLVVRVLLPDGKEVTGEYWDALDTKVKLP